LFVLAASAKGIRKNQKAEKVLILWQNSRAKLAEDGQAKKVIRFYPCCAEFGRDKI